MFAMLWFHTVPIRFMARLTVMVGVFATITSPVAYACGTFTTGARLSSGSISFAVRYFEEDGRSALKFRHTLRNAERKLVFNQELFVSAECQIVAEISREQGSSGIKFRFSNPNDCPILERNSDPLERAFNPSFFDGLVIAAANKPLGDFAAAIEQSACLSVTVLGD